MISLKVFSSLNRPRALPTRLSGSLPSIKTLSVSVYNNLIKGLSKHTNYISTLQSIILPLQPLLRPLFGKYQRELIHE